MNDNSDVFVSRRNKHNLRKTQVEVPSEDSAKVKTFDYFEDGDPFDDSNSGIYNSDLWQAKVNRSLLHKTEHKSNHQLQEAVRTPLDLTSPLATFDYFEDGEPVDDSDSDLNNSDLWLAEVNLSLLHETEHKGNHQLPSSARGCQNSTKLDKSNSNKRNSSLCVEKKEYLQRTKDASLRTVTAVEGSIKFASDHEHQKQSEPLECSRLQGTHDPSLNQYKRKASSPLCNSDCGHHCKERLSAPKMDCRNILDMSEDEDLFEDSLTVDVLEAHLPDEAYSCTKTKALSQEPIEQEETEVPETELLQTKTYESDFTSSHMAKTSTCLHSDQGYISSNIIGLQHCASKPEASRHHDEEECKSETIRRHNNVENSSPVFETKLVGNNFKQTPKTTSGSSLKNRLKNRLLQNASITTPTSNKIEELQNENVSKAQMEASQIRREGLADGIGPFYGLPSKVQELLSTNRKIIKLYDWQDECLKLPAVYEGGNLIYTLPTSGGKTLVAEILILRQLLCKNKNALLILPYISIVQEKVRILSEFATELGFLVEEYAGGKGRFPPTKHRHKHSLFVATIEKGQSLVNCLVEAGRLDEIGLVVVDELHMIGEGGSRGSAMEATLLKVQNATKAPPPQVIGMSATLNNINDLAQFLSAHVFSSDFRPVSLTEFVKVEDSLYEVDNKALVPEDKLKHHKILTFPRVENSEEIDPDHLLNLALEIIPDNSCLLFCPTKRYCENVALMLARTICKHHRHLTNVQKQKRRMLLSELHSDGDGKLCPTLSYTIHFGIAYHHSGLTTDERRLIEDAYSDGVLCLLTCTSTLAAGVNLPAKRVILRSPYVGADFIKHSQYKQMAGRAGRAGIDSSGESILIAKKADMLKVVELLSGPQDVCHSSLMYESGKGLRTLILSLIGLKCVETTQAVFSVMQKTLLAVQATKLDIDIVAAVRLALQELLDQGLVIQRNISPDSPKSCNTILDVADQSNSSIQKNPSQASVKYCGALEAVGLSRKKDTDEVNSQDLFEEVDGQSSKRLRVEKETSPHCSGDLLQSTGSDSTQISLSSHITEMPPNLSLSHLKLDVTDLGRASFKGSVDIECGRRLYQDLRLGETSLVVANHLHLLYLVTPYDLASNITPSWMIYQHQLGTLAEDELKVASLIGVTESYVVRKASGQSTRQKVDMLAVRRFYLTLMLHELWKQFTVWEVAERFQQPRGFIQNLLSSAASFASCVLRFCQELPEFWAYQDLMGNFIKRLTYCVSMELLPLMEVPGVKLGRARQLYSAGYKTLPLLAAADPTHLVSKVQFLTHKAARQIVSAAKVILEEKTEALLEQVELLVPLPRPLSPPAAQQPASTDQAMPS